MNGLGTGAVAAALARRQVLGHHMKRVQDSLLGMGFEPGLQRQALRMRKGNVVAVIGFHRTLVYLDGQWDGFGGFDTTQHDAIIARALALTDDRSTVYEHGVDCPADCGCREHPDRYANTDAEGAV